MTVTVYAETQRYTDEIRQNNPKRPVSVSGILPYLGVSKSGYFEIISNHQKIEGWKQKWYIVGEMLMNNFELSGSKELQKQIDELKKENRILKSLLDSAGISYQERLSENFHEGIGKAAPDQDGRILPHEVTQKDVSRFFGMFWGRMDVYSLRIENAKTGVSGYYPQCNNFWNYDCPKRKREKIKCTKCSRRSFKRLTVNDVARHLYGWNGDKPYVIGIYPLFPDDTCRFIVFDFDNHEKGAGRMFGSFLKNLLMLQQPEGLDMNFLIKELSRSI